MEHHELGDVRLAQRISSMSENEIFHFIRRESRRRGLSKTVRTLNRDALSGDALRREIAQAAIRKLGFI